MRPPLSSEPPLPVTPTTGPEASGVMLRASPLCCCCCRRGAAVASPERTAGRCQPCGKRKAGQGGSGLLLSLPPLSCMSPFELTHVQDCYIIYAKYVSVSLASVMPPLCAVLSRALIS